LANLIARQVAIELKKIHGLQVASMFALEVLPSFAAGTTTVPTDGFLYCNLRVSSAWPKSMRAAEIFVPSGMAGPALCL
jgi:hypothetical protein